MAGQVEPTEWRVLFVPDSIYWATGTICREIARCHSWIRPTVCSTRVLRKLLERDEELLRRIDLVHFLDPWVPDALLTRVLSEAPTVTSIHHVVDSGVVEINGQADRVIVGSRQWLDFLVSTGRVPEERIALVPYGTDPTRFRPAGRARRRSCRRRLGFRDAFVVGFFAKKSSDSEHRKGIDVLTEGLLDLKTRVPGTTALIVGPGWAEEVEKLRAAGIGCRWVPYVLDVHKVVDLYHALDVYWVTARVEGGPLTLLEAMSCGICCVTTAVGLAPEVVVDGVNAYVVPVGDVDLLARRTEALARDSSLRRTMGAAARGTIQESRGWTETTRGIGDVYRDAALHFHERTGKPIALERRPAVSRRTPRGAEDHPLNAVPPSMRRWVRMLEILYWLHNGDFDDSVPAARRLAWRACRANPGSLEPWPHLLKLVSPAIYRRLAARK